MESKKIRLQKYIADSGITSRRKAEELIMQGRVQLNDDVVTELGTKVDPDTDTVSVDGSLVHSYNVDKLYLLMNKPRGCVTTVSDPEGRPTVMDYCKEVSERIYPVGRLDYLSEGLLLLTNDGEMANLVAHPRYEVTKVYEVKVFGAITEDILRKLQEGVELEYGFVKPKLVRVVEQLKGKTWLEFRLNEGKNREIRKICEACGVTIDKLRRVAIGALSIDGVRPGSYMLLTRGQILKKLGIDPKTDRPVSLSEYVSKKKTINLKRSGVQMATPADDRNFLKFRRESYFNTIKEIEVTKKSKAKEERRKSYEDKEAAHEKRQEAKKARINKKEDSKKFVHGMILD